MSTTSSHWQKSPPGLVERFGLILGRFPELEQRKMFGYPAAFLASGHMVTGLHGPSWIVRLGDDDAMTLREAGGVDFEPMPGRPMKGFVSLPTDIVDDDGAVGDWVSRAARHAASLPPKKPRKKRA
jgi:hypothetical protein